MADTMKFLWGANSKIPARSNTTNGKAYFAIVDAGYTDTAAPTNEAFIYLDKAGARYNVIAKRAIFDSLGYKIVDKYFAVANNNGSNMMQFFAPSQNASSATPIGSAAIITSIDLSNSSISASEYKIKTVINGFEDTSTITTTNTANSTLSLGMATEDLAGLVSAGEQVFGGKKIFVGDLEVENNNTLINTNYLTLEGNNNVQINSSAGLLELYGKLGLDLFTSSTSDINLETRAFYVTAPTAINGNTSITGTLDVSGVTSITNTTELDVSNANNIKAALKVSGGVWINKKMQVNGITTFANTTDGSSSGGAVVVSGGAKIAKSVYIGNNLTVAQAISNSRNATFNGTAVTNSYSTTVWGYLYGKNDTTLSRNVVLNGDEPATNTYTTTVKGAATFDKTVTVQDDLIINGDGIFSGDLSVRGGDIFLGAAGDHATITYSSDTITISFPG